MIVGNQRQLANCIRNLRRLYECGYNHQSFDMIGLNIDLITVLNRLNAGDRNIIIKRFLLEELPSEIAMHNHCSSANISQKTSKAIKRFIDEYQRYYHVLLPL